MNNDLDIWEDIKMDKRLLTVITICLIIIFGCTFGIRAKGQASRIPDISNDYYKEIEKEYTQQVRDRLEANGFYNAGVSLTKVVEEDGAFNYTLSVHHRRIDKMNEYQREEISAIIICDGIAVAGSSVSVRYIEY